MSGIRVGTRLEQLYQLRDRLALEIAQEERLELLNGPAPLKVVKHRPPDVVGRRLEQLGLTARQVKDWAVTQGLLERVCRGRVAHELIEAYADAHAPRQDWAS